MKFTDLCLVSFSIRNEYFFSCSAPSRERLRFSAFWKCSTHRWGETHLCPTHFLPEIFLMHHFLSPQILPVILQFPEELESPEETPLWGYLTLSEPPLPHEQLVVYTLKCPPLVCRRSQAVCWSLGAQEILGEVLGVQDARLCSPPPLGLAQLLGSEFTSSVSHAGDKNIQRFTTTLLKLPVLAFQIHLHKLLWGRIYQGQPSSPVNHTALCLHRVLHCFGCSGSHTMSSHCQRCNPLSVL